MMIELEDAVITYVTVITPWWSEDIARRTELKLKHMRCVSFQNLGVLNPCLRIIHIYFNIFLRESSSFSDSPSAARDNSWVSAGSFN
jgi:hypothetical protein